MIRSLTILLLVSSTSTALGQTFSAEALRSLGAYKSAKPPKKFLPASGVAKAGKLQISIASVASGLVKADGGEKERMQISLSVKNTDPKKRVGLGIGKFRSTVVDDNGNDYTVTSVKAPETFDPDDTGTIVVNVELSAMKAKVLRLVLEDGIGWEIKKSDWEKSP